MRGRRLIDGDVHYRSILYGDVLDLINYVDHQDGPTRMRGDTHGVAAAYDRMVSTAEDASAMVQRMDQWSNSELENKRNVLAAMVRRYRDAMAASNRDDGYESD